MRKRKPTKKKTVVLALTVPAEVRRNLKVAAVLAGKPMGALAAEALAGIADRYRATRPLRDRKLSPAEAA